MDALVPILQNAREIRDRPVLVHVVTQKGKGYAPAESADDKLHAVARFDVVTGRQAKPSQPAPPAYTRVFADALIREAESDPRIVAVTAAMPSGTGLDLFEKRFPDRTFDVGIAEQHAVTFAAGLAADGMKPFAAIYSTFLQRGYDQVVHDVAIQRLPVRFAIDRAGLVGADGPTHAGVYDIPFLRCVPQVSIACPADENECRMLLSTAHAQDHTVAVRYPRGAGVGTAQAAGLASLPFGKGEIRRQGKSVAILAFGTLLYPAIEAAKALNATVVNMRWAKPLDTELLLQIAASHQALVTVEEGALMGGAGSAVLEALQDAHIQLSVLRLGVPDVFTDHGDPVKIMSALGLDAAGIEASVRGRFNHLLSADDKTNASNLKLVG
jgi:1-deoxy-D-xylulose-5-phosphate synthase